MPAWLRVICIGLLLSAQGDSADLAEHRASLIQVTPPSIDFGVRPVGSKSQPLTATLTNVSSGPVIIRDITASGIDFSQINNCQNTLQARAECTIEATFLPATTGPRLGTIIITADPPSTLFLVLTGEGEETAP